MAVDPISLVRDKTTDDGAWLPTTKIEFYLEYWSGDWKMTAADCLDYMARDDIYEQYQRGGIKVAKPLLKERAKELRAQVTSGAGYEMTTSEMTRGEYQQYEDVEYLRQHPPYQYGRGLLRVAKEEAGIESGS
jgi:hypothetical protein